MPIDLKGRRAEYISVRTFFFSFELSIIVIGEWQDVKDSLFEAKYGEFESSKISQELSTEFSFLNMNSFAPSTDLNAMSKTKCWDLNTLTFAKQCAC